MQFATGIELVRAGHDRLVSALPPGAVALHAVPGRGLRGHMEINRRLGDPAYPATAVVDAWLARIFAR